MSYHPAKYMSDMGATKINFLTVKVSKLSSTYGSYHLSHKLSCTCHWQVSCWGGRYCSRVNILWQIVNRSKGHLNRYESDRSMSHCKCFPQNVYSHLQILKMIQFACITINKILAKGVVFVLAIIFWLKLKGRLIDLANFFSHGKCLLENIYSQLLV